MDLDYFPNGFLNVCGDCEDGEWIPDIEAEMNGD